MIDLPFTLNSEPVKYAVIVLTTPVWLPFLRALWKELNDSLRDEGGILGFAPSRRELDKINRREGRHDTPLISETWDEHEAERGSAATRRVRTGAARAPRPRGFR